MPQIVPRIKHMHTTRVCCRKVSLNHPDNRLLTDLATNNDWGYKCDIINKHADLFFKRLHLLKVADILKIQELKLYFRFIHNTLPRYLQRLAYIYIYI